jgi:hypothetical protein
VLRIELDKPGEPHWLSKQARRLRVIMGKTRQLRLRIRDRPRLLRRVK